MALANITNYATLQAAVAEMAHRAGHADSVSSVPTLIQLCEADLNDSLLLKDMESDESLTLVTSQNYVALPTGYVSPIAAWLVIDSERVPLTPCTPEQLPYYSTNGQPEFYAIDAANLRFDRPADSAYSARLRCIKTSNLSGSNTTNALLLKRPDVYLYGALTQLAVYIDDDRNLSKWSSIYERGKKSLKAAESRNRAIAPLRTDIPSARRSGNIIRGD